MPTTLEFKPDATPEQIAGEVRDAWSSSNVIHIVGPRPQGDIREFYWPVLSTLGQPLALAEDATLGDRGQQRSGSYWSEVRFDPDMPQGYRHTANAQPLHTDGAYTSPGSVKSEVGPNPLGTGFLACVAMPAGGGATTFIDAEELMAALAEEAPELLERLRNTVVPHARSGDRKVAKVIDSNGDGAARLNWNYYCVDTQAGEEVRQLAEDFFQFLRTSAAVDARTARVKLDPGSAVLWKDDYVLHGRDAFDPEGKSARFLWKTSLLIAA